MDTRSAGALGSISSVTNLTSTALMFRASPGEICILLRSLLVKVGCSGIDMCSLANERKLFPTLMF